MSLTATAPGKIVICGEYAVVEGAPGIVAASDRRARVTVEFSSRPGLTVNALPLRSRPLELAWKDGGLTGFSDADRPVVSLLDAVLKHLGPALPAPLPGLDLTLDTRDFFDGGKKLGLGSSAALCMALLLALARAFGAEKPNLQQAIRCHRAFQSGAGSGIDVAASLQGGLLAFSRGASPDRATAVRQDWPSGMGGRLVWVGQSASTTARLARLSEYQRQHPAAAAQAMQQLKSRAEAAARAFETGDAAVVMAAISGFYRTLLRLDGAAGLDVLTAPHHACQRIVQGHDVLYKTCGAGGGDLGILLGTNEDQLDQLAGNINGSGYPTWPLAIGGQGAIVADA